MFKRDIRPTLELEERINQRDIQAAREYLLMLKTDKSFDPIISSINKAVALVVANDLIKDEGAANV